MKGRGGSPLSGSSQTTARGKVSGKWAYSRVGVFWGQFFPQVPRWSVWVRVTGKGK